MWRTDMATQLMKDWIVELHNPERKQMTGGLGVINSEGVKSNCCLGVLCEVNGTNPIEGAKYDDYGTELVYDGRTGMPNIEVIAALFAEDSDLIGENESVDLYEEEDEDLDGTPYTRTVTADYANDARGKSFTEIADLLSERYLSGEEQFEVRKAVEDKGWA
jgi:hypothetical protein